MRAGADGWRSSNSDLPRGGEGCSVQGQDARCKESKTQRQHCENALKQRGSQGVRDLTGAPPRGAHPCQFDPWTGFNIDTNNPCLGFPPHNLLPSATRFVLSCRRVKTLWYCYESILCHRTTPTTAARFRTVVRSRAWMAQTKLTLAVIPMILRTRLQLAATAVLLSCFFSRQHNRRERMASGIWDGWMVAQRPKI